MTWWETQDCHLARSCRRTATVATMQCQSASLCVDLQFSTVLVVVYRADLKSHVQCWTWCQVLILPVEGMVRLLPVSQSTTSSAVMLGCHLRTTIALLRLSTKQSPSNDCMAIARHNMAYRVLQQCPTKQGQMLQQKTVTVHTRACLLASELLESPLWIPFASQNL